MMNNEGKTKAYNRQVMVIVFRLCLPLFGKFILNSSIQIYLLTLGVIMYMFINIIKHIAGISTVRLTVGICTVFVRSCILMQKELVKYKKSFFDCIGEFP